MIIIIKNQAYQLVRISYKNPGHHNSPAVRKPHLTCPTTKDTNRTQTVPTAPTKDVTADMERQKLLYLPEKVRAWKDRKYHQKTKHSMIYKNCLGIGPLATITQPASWTGAAQIRQSY